jgi:hypothetical protein
LRFGQTGAGDSGACLPQARSQKQHENLIAAFPMLKEASGAACNAPVQPPRRFWGGA